MNLTPETARLIETHGLQRVEQAIRNAAADSLGIVKKVKVTEQAGPRGLFGLMKGKTSRTIQAEPVQLGGSKFGGVPHVPEGFEWPRGKKPLGFIAQINCSEAAHLLPSLQLPGQGMLYFFYDFVEQPWGGDTLAEGGKLVVYMEDLAELQPAVVPAGRSREELMLPEFAIGFRPLPSFPGHEAPEMEALGLEGEEDEGYMEFVEESSQLLLGMDPRHKIGGYADNVQGDVRAEFEVYSKRPDGTAKMADWEAASRHVDEWVLLLQVDSDDALNVMWGDAGMIYYGIRREDLAARRFEKTGVILQCC